MVVAVASLVGTPTAGALLSKTDDAHFRNLIIFCGVLSVAGTVVMALAGIVGSSALRGRLGRWCGSLRDMSAPETLKKSEDV